MPKKPVEPSVPDTWNDNAIQFPRLIAEIEAAGGFDDELVRTLCSSMDLDISDLMSLIDRAQKEWDEIKQRTR